MTDDAGFGVVKSLDLEERVRALVLILRFRLTEHQAVTGGQEKSSREPWGLCGGECRQHSPFSSEAPDLLELLFEVIPPVTLFLLDDADEAFSLFLTRNSTAAATGDRVLSSGRRGSGRLGTRAREQSFEEALAGFERLRPFRRNVKHLSANGADSSQYPCIVGHWECDRGKITM